MPNLHFLYFFGGLSRRAIDCSLKLLLLSSSLLSSDCSSSQTFKNHKRIGLAAPRLNHWLPPCLKPVVLGEAHSQKIKKESGFGRGAAKPELLFIFWEFEPESYRRRGDCRLKLRLLSRAKLREERPMDLVDVGELQTICHPIYVYALVILEL